VARQADAGWARKNNKNQKRGGQASQSERHHYDWLEYVVEAV
jgi:hypothetical protein